MIIGISGLAGSGKDTVADFLVQQRDYVKVALADPLKRICQDVFDFSDDQLWGPSEKRNAPDKRYPRNERYLYPATPAGALWLPIGGGHTLIDEADLETVTSKKWCLNKEESGKRVVYVRETTTSLKLHQFLLGAAPEGSVIDHINGDGCDNRKSNLRFCTHAENHANEVKRAGGSSPFKGVGFDVSRQKWVAKITVSGGTRNLGRVDNEADAAGAYDKAAVEAFGGYARTNASMFLTPRYALQQLGTNWGRNCYDDVWIEYALRVARRLEEGGCYYDVRTGLRFTTEVEGVMEARKNVVISDVRFKNEVKALREAGALVWRVRRKGYEEPRWNHPSETEQTEIPDQAFHGIILNEGSLDDLLNATLSLETELRRKVLDFKSRGQWPALGGWP